MRRRHALGVLWSIAAAGCGAAQREPLEVPDDEPLTRSQARARLAQLAGRYEELMREHGHHQWSRYAGKTDDAAEAAARMERLRKAETEVFAEAREIVDTQLRTLLAPRQAELWRRGALGLRLLGDPRSAELGDELEQTISAHRFALGDRPVSRGAISKMRRSGNARERRRSRQLEFTLHEKARPIATELLKRRRALAKELTLPTYFDELLKLRGVPPPRLKELMDGFFRSTRRDYDRLVRAIARAVRKRRPEPWDYDYALERIFRHPPDERFPADAAMPTARRLYRAFGIDLEQPKLDVTVRDFAFGGQAIGVRIPDDVRIVVRPSPGARFYGTLLHELGHAYAATRTRARHALYKGYEWVPGLSEPAFAEGLAEVFGRLLDEPAVLREHLGLSDVEARRVVASRRAAALHRARRTIGWIWFERTALAHPTGDLDKLSLVVERRHTGAASQNAEPIWATSPFLATYPVYVQSYLLASMMAVQIRAALKARFGDRWISPEAGRHLTASVVEDGARWTFDEKMIRATGQRLGPEALVRFITGRR